MATREGKAEWHCSLLATELSLAVRLFKGAESPPSPLDRFRRVLFSFSGVLTRYRLYESSPTGFSYPEISPMRCQLINARGFWRSHRTYIASLPHLVLPLVARATALMPAASLLKMSATSTRLRPRA